MATEEASSVGAESPELLAPAGGPGEFNAALASGADAIYCGFGRTFNARRGAESFTSQTFADACRRAHVLGTRVYVTVNVAIRDDEMPSVLGLVRRAWLLGADAFIIQDWGLLAEVRRRWPEVECHVSTQANVHDARGVAWCAELGVARVTLSRELSLPEIARIAREGVDLECFCHGAICFCYSGVCQLSSSAGSRSANRGTCAQPCRLPYELVDGRGRALAAADRGRPLCPRDFYGFEDLAALRDAGASALKIEGRLKGADYLVSVVSTYREQLDDMAAGREPDAEVLASRRRRLKRAFNRDFTNAYLLGTSGDELMSYERSNNRGELVGSVVDSQAYGTVKVRRGGDRGGRERLRTVSVAEARILLREPVGRGDLLEIRPTQDPSQYLTTHAQEDARAGETITCRTARKMPAGSLVRVIRSKRAMDDGARAADGTALRRRPVDVRVRARLGQPFLVELTTADGGASACAEGFVVEAARTRAVTDEDLVAHVGRMGSTPFEPRDVVVELDEGCGMGFSAVHAVRAAACEALEHAILEPYQGRELTDGLGDLRMAGGEPQEKSQVEVCALVADASSARSAVRAGATRVYATADDLSRGLWPEGVVPLLDEVCREADHERLDPWVREGLPVAVGNVSELALARAMGSRPEVRGCIPVHNGSCVRALEEAGAAGFWLSPELSLEEVRAVARQASVPVGVVALGRVRAMTSEHCVLQVADRCAHDCARCGLRAQATFLRDDAGELLPVRTDAQGRSRIYAAKVTDLAPNVADLVAAGVTRLGADCTLLSPDETSEAVRRVAEAVDAWQHGRPTPRQLPGTTTGHLFQPIS